MLFWGLWLEASVIAIIAMLDASIVVLDTAHELLCGGEAGLKSRRLFLVDKTQ